MVVQLLTHYLLHIQNRAHMRIQKSARAQKRMVLRVIQSIEGAAFIQPSALTLTKPQKKTNACLKFETLRSQGPLD